MAPFGLMSAGVSLLAKSFTVFSCTSSLQRCTSVLPLSFFSPLRCLTTQASNPPKRPPNGYIRFVVQQKPMLTRQHPDTKPVDIMKMLGQQWRGMSPEQKQPFQEAAQLALAQFKVDREHYQAQLTPTQLKQQTLERRERIVKRRAYRKKRELTTLGKPKRPRTSFNIFMSEHFEEAKGASTTEKLKTLTNDWKNLFAHQRQIYKQLSEDDKIRYRNEMKLWEEHMVEIGREDVLRMKTLSKWKKAVSNTSKAKNAKARKSVKELKKTPAKSNTKKKTSTSKTVGSTKTK